MITESEIPVNDNKISQRHIQIIKERDNEIQEKTEKITTRDIQIKLDRFVCKKCKSHWLRRSNQSKRKNAHNQVKFRCRSCGNVSKDIYDKKEESLIEFEEYLKIIKNQI
ncbi:MAG: hypothetical protein ACOC4M_14135 [Promethearchaeia archaeon]